MTTTADTNVKRMRQLCQLVQQEKRIDLFEDYFHEDFRDHPLTGGTTDRNTGRKFMMALHTCVDNLEVVVLECIGQGDMVATHKVFRGRLNADFLGQTRGAELNLRVMDFMKMRDGKAIEHWATQDPIGARQW